MSKFTFRSNETIERLSGNAERGTKIGHLRLRLPHCCTSKTYFRRCHLERPAAIAAARTGGLQARFGPLDDQRPFKLRQRGEYAKYQPAISGRSVDRRAFAGEHLQADVPFGQIVNEVDEVTKIATETIQLPDATGRDVTRYVFVPVTNQGQQPGAQTVGGPEGSHWSLLMIDRLAGAAHYYDSSFSETQGQFAMTMAGAIAHGAAVMRQPMAEQANGYDCGVAVLAATRALIGTLPTGLLPDNRMLDLSLVDIDRGLVQTLLGGQPAIADDDDNADEDTDTDEDMQESDPSLSDQEMDEEPDLAALAEPTPRHEGENASAYARRLHAAHPALTIPELCREPLRTM